MVGHGAVVALAQREPDRRTADKITSCNFYYFQTHTMHVHGSPYFSATCVWIVRLSGECKMCELSFVGVIKPFFIVTFIIATNSLSG